MPNRRDLSVALIVLCVAVIVLHRWSTPPAPAAAEQPFCPVPVDHFAQAFNARAERTGWEPRLTSLGCEPDKEICRYLMMPEGTWRRTAG